MTHPHDHPVRAELQSLDQRRADTLADALRPDDAPTGEATTAEQLAARDAEIARLGSVCDDLQTAWLTASAERDAARDQLAAVTADAHAAEQERDAALAIIAGRTVPPTAAEIAAHVAAGGRWRCVVVGDRSLSCDMLPGGVVWYHAETLKVLDATGTWWALDATGRPCAWPVADVSDTARRGGV